MSETINILISFSQGSCKESIINQLSWSCHTDGCSLGL